MPKLEMPVVKAFENGTFELTTPNGWEITYPAPDKTSLVTVIENKEAEAVVTVMHSCLDAGESVWVNLAVALGEMLSEEIETSADDDDVEVVLAEAVNKGITAVGNAYNEGDEDDDEAEAAE